jgi:hypothetical protein
MPIWAKPIIFAVGFFTLIKIFFGILGWYSRTGSDDIYRNSLDNLWERLHKESLFEVVHGILSQLVSRIDAILKHRYLAFFLFIFISFTINCIAIALSFAILFFKVNPIQYLFPFLLGLFTETFRNYLIIAFMGALFDVISVFITIWLIRLASVSLSLLKATCHFIIDIILAFLSFYFTVYAALITVQLLVAPNIEFVSILQQAMITMRMALYYYSEVWSFLINGINLSQLSNSQAISLMLLIIGLSSVLPTLLYLSISVFIVAIKFIPNSFKSVVMNIIFLVTTDNKPVLSQLGTAFGVLVGALGAILTIIKIE